MLTVLGKDRPGIISNVTRTLFRHGCNLEDVSMTILEAEFAMILVACLRHDKKKKAIQKEFSSLEKKGRLAFFWRDLKKAPARGEKHQKNSTSYIVSAVGRDRTGIVYKTSQVIAQAGLNITDLNCKILGHGPSTLYAMFLEVDIPKKFLFAKLEHSLRILERQLGVEIRLKPVERIEF